VEQTYKGIVGHEKLLERFGHWPSFHDAEVISVRLERDRGEPLTGPVLTFVFHLFRIEVAPDDPARDNTVTSICFREVESLRLFDFNHQNAISGLAIATSYCQKLSGPIFSVEIKPGFGLSCSFSCTQIEVLSVEPYKPKWGAWST